ncbi:restriction endonuclease subunit S domain-containing protein [Oceanivirga miroungae]|uniref:Uncharacterized protein n=1 Tax=Oceanivirga miroungae TaxID=1130046 RepID=A0A6I8MDW0_9FUSO|nr:hypothetical protein [Oceanivirga miroungae]VWL85624.1 hypothetical protein OMES3154_00909 [Oceanivirga miroungae]
MKRENVEKYLGEIVKIKYPYKLASFISYKNKKYDYKISNKAFRIGRITDLHDEYIILNRAVRIKISEIEKLKKYEYRNDIIDNKLISPIGEFKVYLDGIEVNYEVVPIEKTIRTINTDGMYCVKVNIEPDEKRHRISFGINNLDEKKLDIWDEADERLEILNYENQYIHLAVGLNSESITLNQTEEEYFRYYGIDYIVDELGYEITENTKTKEYFFGVAYIFGSYSEEVFLGVEPVKSEYYISKKILANCGKLTLENEKRIICFENGKIMDVIDNYIA